MPSNIDEKHNHVFYDCFALKNIIKSDTAKEKVPSDDITKKHMSRRKKEQLEDRIFDAESIVDVSSQSDLSDDYNK